ncbi:MAG: SufE family protein [Schleiferiaceae bacterium]|jgi:cysteine desulfuration protein SufE
MSTLETLKAREAEVVEEFEFFDEWMDRYEHIIAQGKTLPAASEAIKTDENLIRGCQSKVWITAEKREGLVFFTADSDAIITRGLVALLLRVCNGLTPEVLAQADFGFLQEIGLTEHLSPTRANGLQSMMKQIRLYGVAFQAVN